MARWWQWSHQACPHCRQDEDACHVICCPEVTEAWKAVVDSLLEWVDSTQPAPATLALLGLMLDAWRSRWPMCLDIQWPEALWQSVTEQKQVGWASFLEGFVVCLWAMAQQEYFTACGCCSLGQVWTTQLIGHLWMLGQHMWEHHNLVLHHGSSIPQFLC